MLSHWRSSPWPSCFPHEWAQHDPHAFPMNELTLTLMLPPWMSSPWPSCFPHEWAHLDPFAVAQLHDKLTVVNEPMATREVQAPVLPVDGMVATHLVQPRGVQVSLHTNIWIIWFKRTASRDNRVKSKMEINVFCILHLMSELSYQQTRIQHDVSWCFPLELNWIRQDVSVSLSLHDVSWCFPLHRHWIRQDGSVSLSLQDVWDSLT